MNKFVLSVSRCLIPAFVTACLATGSQALANPPCSVPDAVVQMVQAQLATVLNLSDHNGGLLNQPNKMWSAIVDRQGVLCSVISSDPNAWPGSRAIAIAKASTANDFSNSDLALSTANLYSFTQPANTYVPPSGSSGTGNTRFYPAGSLYGLNNSNPFNPEFQGQGTGLREVPGGIITFGGGVALYSGGRVIGGLGVSGDSACADHAIAFRIRKQAGLDATPNGSGSDNIQYLAPGELPHDLGHPHCSPNDISPSQIANPGSGSPGSGWDLGKQKGA